MFLVQRLLSRQSASTAQQVVEEPQASEEEQNDEEEEDDDEHSGIDGRGACLGKCAQYRQGCGHLDEADGVGGADSVGSGHARQSGRHPGRARGNRRRSR